MPLATVALTTSSLGTKFLGSIVPRYNVPHNNCSSWQLFHTTIVPLDICSSQQLFLRSFANGHLQRGRSYGWPKSRGRRSTDCCKWSSGWSGLLRSFENGRLQRGLSSGWPTFFWSDGADLPLVWRILNTTFQLKQTNGSGVRAKWPMNIEVEVR